jgi:hypothetical protein
MAATTGADAISAAASRSASFRMILTKRFSNRPGKNPTRELFFWFHTRLRAYLKVYWLPLRDMSLTNTKDSPAANGSDFLTVRLASKEI